MTLGVIFPDLRSIFQHLNSTKFILDKDKDSLKHVLMLNWSQFKSNQERETPNHRQNSLTYTHLHPRQQHQKCDNNHSSGSHTHTVGHWPAHSPWPTTATVTRHVRPRSGASNLIFIWSRNAHTWRTQSSARSVVVFLVTRAPSAPPFWGWVGTGDKGLCLFVFYLTASVAFIAFYNRWCWFFLLIFFLRAADLLGREDCQLLNSSKSLLIY